MDHLENCPFPLDLLEDQAPLYRTITAHLLDRYGEYVEEALPPAPPTSASAFPHPHQYSRILMKNRFWSPQAPSIPFPEYIQRISQAMPKLETTVLLAIPIYARRLESRWKASAGWPPNGLRLGSNLLHRFAITTVCLASKALGDQFYSNEYCAAVGGIGVKELHGLELELAARLSWDLQCSREEYAWSWAQLSTFLFVVDKA